MVLVLFALIALRWQNPLVPSSRSTSDGRVTIEATSVPSATFAVGSYLREMCNASLTWVKTGGLIPRCPASGPMPAYPVGKTRVLTRALKWTYYQNVVDSSYRWRKSPSLIDSANDIVCWLIVFTENIHFFVSARATRTLSFSFGHGEPQLISALSFPAIVLCGGTWRGGTRKLTGWR